MTPPIKLKRSDSLRQQLDNWADEFSEFSGGVRLQVQSPSGVSEMKTFAVGDLQISAKVLRQQVPLPPPEPLPPAPPVPIPPPPDIVSPIAAPESYCPVRVPRFAWLTWLFNLISVER